ncbi:hypothetical protein Nepgr_032303 [Nepenthes gracilis]|uniref:Uncharacterized protein n=1 Tax=Nepenthes gracilis TaxID=150966 RepID=A0AAD3TJ13_NEPGR|nr:hypothetical protein Nepgr_032303 [Nepenthes gracilis]
MPDSASAAGMVQNPGAVLEGSCLQSLLKILLADVISQADLDDLMWMLAILVPFGDLDVRRLADMAKLL